MTRFARAKGSKASNERLPEEATSWTDMKQQLEETQKHKAIEGKRKEAESMRLENYNKFLKETENSQTVSWSDFPESQPIKKPIKSKLDKKQKNGTQSKNGTQLERNNNSNSKEKGGKRNFVDVTGNNDDTTVEMKVKKKKKAKNNQDEPHDVGIIKENVQNNEIKPIKGKNVEEINKEPKDGTINKVETNNIETGENPKVLSKKSKKKKEVVPFKTKKTLDDMSEYEKAKFLKSKEKKRNQWLRRKEKKDQEKAEKKALALQNAPPTPTPIQNGPPTSIQNAPATHNSATQVSPKKEKKAKIQGFQANRRKPKQETEKINGVEVAIRYFDGYPVTGEEFSRLDKLRKEMISKGVPRKQVQEALKLERRKSSKALSRMKKVCCFACRKFGHTIQECPEASSQELVPHGTCLKCGSTEHSYNNCRLIKSEEFKFATCFICKEQGHISRQCPDNARGMYPKGGSCKICGDVTHLRKDCPQLMMEKESNQITLDTFGSSTGIETIEGLENKNGPNSFKLNGVNATTTKAKHVKFD